MSFMRNAAFVLVPLVALSAQESRKSPVLRGMDPVELVQGVEKPGVDDWSIEHEQARYVFATEANLRAFQKEPGRYEIQFGGACGRMGPGSGRGQPSRFGVHNGRIYVFASDQCRTSFLKAPEKFLDPDDPAPAGNAAARTAGAALVDKAVAAFGGAARLDPGMTYETVRTWKTKTKEGEREDRERLRISGDRYRLDEDWGNWSFTTVVDGKTGFTITDSGKIEGMHATALRDFERKVLRIPILLMRARSRNSFQASTITVEGSPNLTWVAVSVSGTTTNLGIDPKTGQVQHARYRGRGPELYYGEVAKLYGDFRDVGGAAIPFRIDVTFDGKPRPEAARVFEAITIGGKIDDAVFARPKGE